MRARVVNNVAIDVLPDRLVPAGQAAQFEPVPDHVGPMWVRLQALQGDQLQSGQSTWQPPGTRLVEQSPGSWAYVAASAPPEVAAAPLRRLTRLAFRQRFTVAEKARIVGAARQNTQEGAAVQAYLDDVQAATFIDVARPDTRAGVLALEAAGLLDAEGRALQILDAPVQPSEAPSAAAMAMES